MAEGHGRLPSDERQDAMMAACERAGYEPNRVLSHEVVQCYDSKYEFVFCRVVEDRVYVYRYSHEA